MGISFAVILTPSLSRIIMDLDSFFDGDNGIEGVLELSTNISLISTFDFFETSSLIDCMRFLVIALPVIDTSNTDLNKFRFR